MRVRYFGLVLDTDVAFPELESPEGGHGPEWLRLRRGVGPCAPSAVTWFREVRADDEEPWLSVGRTDDGYVLDFHRVLCLHYRSPLVSWFGRADASEASCRHILLDQAMPLIAAQEGHTVLHGACAVCDAGAVLFAGPAGSGKSTLVASLLAAGWRSAADDAASIVLQGDSVLARPSYGGLRLWPDSSEALGYAGGAPVAAYSDKRRFHAQRLDGDVPLRAVYVLRPTERGPARVRRLSQRDALIALVSNAYVLDISDAGRVRAPFEALTTVVEQLPVWELTVPHRFDLLEGVRGLVEQQLSAEAWS